MPFIAKDDPEYWSAGPEFLQAIKQQAEAYGQAGQQERGRPGGAARDPEQVRAGVGRHSGAVWIPFLSGT